ncbi:MAG: hypothetical protein AMXMBFR23_09230 [Chloroflexota bacterium]
MFNRARRQLTLIYASAGVLLFALVAAVIFVTVVTIMDREIDADIVEVVESSSELLAINRGLDEVEAPVAFGPVFVFAFDATGTLVANPRGLDAAEMVPRMTLLAATTSGEQRRFTRRIDDERFRLHIHPHIVEGEIFGTIVAGRSLARRDTEVRVVAWTLAGGVGAWAVLGTALAWFVAGRALRPVREAYLRQEAFVAGAAHELRSPIAVIRAASGVALRQSPPPEVGELLEEIDTVAHEASDLVDTLLDLARLSPPAGEEMVTSDLAAVVGREVARLRPLLDEHDVRLVDHLEAVAVFATPAAIGRVTRALLENVIAHTPRGTTVLVRTRELGGYGELAVEDDGPGLPAERQEAVFEPFSRGDAARRRDRGAGMGLSIVRNVAAHYGGWVRARTPSSGRGLVVEVGLPVSHRPPSREPAGG